MRETPVHLYIHRNLINNKCYIGQTSLPLKTRWANGKGYQTSRYFGAAIQKYGWENFTHESLGDVCPFLADFMERHYIKYFKSVDPLFGYNLETGGGVNKEITDSTRKKMSSAKLGKKHSEDHRKKNSEAHLNNKNALGCRWHQSAEAKEKIAKAHLGKHLSEETRKKISEANKGLKINRNSEQKKEVSEESRRKMSLAHLGKKHSEETKRKMAEAHKKKT